MVRLGGNPTGKLERSQRRFNSSMVRLGVKSPYLYTKKKP